jgi:hypothetical protein
MTEEFLRLLVEVKGQAALADLKKQLSDVEAEEQNLKAAYQGNTITAEELDKETRRLAASHKELSRSIEAVEKGFPKASSGMAGFGQSAMQTGRVAQDFAQGGIGGILNNIEGLTMALGGGAGLAGALTLVGVAFLALKPKIGEIADSLGLFQTEIVTTKQQIEALKKQVEDLEKKPGKLFIDIQQLNEAEKHLETLERRLAAFNKAKITAGAEDLATRATKAVRETVGSEAIEKAVFEQDRIAGRSYGKAEDEAAAAKIRAQIKGVEDRIRLGATTRKDAQSTLDILAGQLEPILVRIDEANRARAKQTVGAFLEGDVGAIAEMQTRIGRAPGAFDEDFRRMVGNLPGSAAAAAKERRDKKIDELNEMGLENQEIALKEREKIDAERTKAAEDATKTETEADENVKKHMTKVAADRTAAATRESEAKKRQIESSTTVDEEAALAAARYRAMGGYEDPRTGRFVKLSPLEQQAALEEDILRRLRPQKLGKAAAPVAMGLATQAFEAVDRESADLVARGMDASGANQEVILTALEHLTARVEASEARSKNLGRRAAQIEQRTRNFTSSDIPGF